MPPGDPKFPRGHIVGTVEDNIDAFVIESPDLAPFLPDEVKWALASHQREQDLKVFIGGLGCDLVAPEDVGGYRGWLRDIARRVQGRLA